MADPTTAQHETPVEASPTNANRVWVGNLAYKSSEQDLRDAFAGMKMYVASYPPPPIPLHKAPC
jgi:RNA recognition motif-containing protein